MVCSGALRKSFAHTYLQIKKKGKSRSPTLTLSRKLLYGINLLFCVGNRSGAEFFEQFSKLGSQLTGTFAGAFLFHAIDQFVFQRFHFFSDTINELLRKSINYLITFFSTFLFGFLVRFLSFLCGFFHFFHFFLFRFFCFLRHLCFLL